MKHSYLMQTRAVVWEQITQPIFKSKLYDDWSMRMPETASEIDKQTD